MRETRGSTGLSVLTNCNKQSLVKYMQMYIKPLVDLLNISSQSEAEENNEYGWIVETIY